MKKLAKAILISQLIMNPAWAQNAFVVKNIRVQGLHYINSKTVESYLPVKRGETFKTSKSGDVIRALYKTGFFDRISLAKDNDGTLIINVIERPVIGQLKIKGNSVVQTDKLTSVMKTLDVAEGRVYSPAVLSKIRQSLLNQYYQLGYYNARVDITTTPMPRNRVAVNINISEGLIARIYHVSIIGNHAFSERTLVNQLTLSSTGVVTLFTQADQYSEGKLEESAEKLRNYYLDHGYLRAEVKYSQAQISPDRKTVYVTFVVNEGDLYRINRVTIEGSTIVPPAEIRQRILIKPGDVFSRQQIIDSEKRVNDFYGNRGYLFSTISVKPEVNDEQHLINLTLLINPGKRSYVRHINFSDNRKTNDITLRRELVQMEGAPASTVRLEESKHRLSMLPFIKNVDMAITPVPGVDDQVDVNYRVTEDSASTASFQLGYSEQYHVMLGFSFNQKNFMGTGNTLGINLNHSKYNSLYAIDFTNPYYTPDGISRSISFSFSRNEPGTYSWTSSYVTNEYDAGLFYTIPLGEDADALNRLIIGGAYQDTSVHYNSKVPTQLIAFAQRHGKHFQEFDFRLGFSHNSLDRGIFPTRGNYEALTFDTYAPLSSNSLSYYNLYFTSRYYQPIYKSFIFLTKLNLGYGNGYHGVTDFPYFRNYFAGGIDSVRGFAPATLGPDDSLGNPYGGNILTTASIGLIFPNFISESLRTSFFVDAGNVYTSLNNRAYGGQSTMSGPIRYSFGLEADVLSPFGPIELSVARGIRDKHDHDQLQFFQFSLGANF